MLNRRGVVPHSGGTTPAPVLTVSGREVLAQLLCFAAVYVKLNLDVGLEAGSTRVTLRKWQELSGQERDAEIEFLARDRIAYCMRLELRSIA